MLVITTAAKDFIRCIPAQEGSPGSAGLRISAGSLVGEGLQVRAVSSSEAGDAVVEDAGARVFMGAGAAERLSHHVLDVRTDELGRAEFITTPLPT